MWYDHAVDAETVTTARKVRLAAPIPTSELFHGPDRTLYLQGGDGRVARVRGADVEFQTRRGSWTPRRSRGWGDFRS